MPIHDWTRVPAGVFHDFHQTWTIHIKAALNAGLLPEGLSAYVEQYARRREGDVLAIESRTNQGRPDFADAGGILTADDPATSIVRKTDRERYAARANRIVVRQNLGRIVAAIEIVSPGNKDRKSAIREFVTKSVEFIDKGIHLLVVDLCSLHRRHDPFGIAQGDLGRVCRRRFHAAARQEQNPGLVRFGRRKNGLRRTDRRRRRFASDAAVH